MYMYVCNVCMYACMWWFRIHYRLSGMCVYICVRACMHMYVCMHACDDSVSITSWVVCVSIYVCMHACICRYVTVCTWWLVPSGVNIYTYIHIYYTKHAFMRQHACVHTFVPYRHTCIQAHIACMYAYDSLALCLYIYIYIYIYIICIHILTYIHTHTQFCMDIKMEVSMIGSHKIASQCMHKHVRTYLATSNCHARDLPLAGLLEIRKKASCRHLM